MMVDYLGTISKLTTIYKVISEKSKDSKDEQKELLSRWKKKIDTTCKEFEDNIYSSKEYYIPCDTADVIYTELVRVITNNDIIMDENKIRKTLDISTHISNQLMNNVYKKLNESFEYWSMQNITNISKKTDFIYEKTDLITDLHEKTNEIDEYFLALKNISSNIVNSNTEKSKNYILPQLNILEQFCISIDEQSEMDIQYTTKTENDFFRIRFNVKKQGLISEFENSEEYLSHLNYTMQDDVLEILGYEIIHKDKKNDSKTLHQYTGSSCYLPWMQFNNLIIKTLNNENICQSSVNTLKIIPKKIIVSYDIENESREKLIVGLEYKLKREKNNDYLFCYYENENSKNNFILDIKFAYKKIGVENNSICIKKIPIITTDLKPIIYSRADSLLDYSQILLKLVNSKELKFRDRETNIVDFTITTTVKTDYTLEILKDLIEIYRKILNIEEHFNVKFEIQFPIDTKTIAHIEIINQLIKNKNIIKVENLILKLHTESLKLTIGKYTKYIIKYPINTTLFHIELPIEDTYLIFNKITIIEQNEELSTILASDDLVLHWDIDGIIKNENDILVVKQIQ